MLFVIAFLGGSEAQAFSGSLIELLCDGVALVLREVCHALSFGDVLSYQAVGVFVGSAFPGVIRSGEVEAGAGFLFDGRVAMELSSVIGCDRSDSSRLAANKPCCSPVNLRCGSCLEFPEYGVASFSFDEAQQAWFAWADHSIDLPVPDLFSVFDGSGSCGDVSFGSKTSAAIVTSVSFAALF